MLEPHHAHGRHLQREAHRKWTDLSGTHCISDRIMKSSKVSVTPPRSWCAHSPDLARAVVLADADAVLKYAAATMSFGLTFASHAAPPGMM